MATSAGTVFVDVRPDLDNFNRQLASGVTGTSGGMMGKLKGWGDKLGGTFGGAFAGGFSAMGLMEGARMVTDFVGSTIEAASALQEQQNKTNVVFGEGAEEILSWSEGAAEAMGMSQKAALEGASTFKAMTDAMGVSAEVGTDMSTSLVQLASDMASFHDASPEDMLLAFRSALSGEFEPMKKFGVVMNEASLSAEAMAIGVSKTGTEMTAAQKAQAAYSLLMKQTSAAQGDFAATSDSLANTQRSATARLEDAKAAMGEELLPTMVEVTEALTKFAEAAGPILAESLGMAVEATQPFLDQLTLLSDVLPETGSKSAEAADGTSMLSQAMAAANKVNPIRLLGAYNNKVLDLVGLTDDASDGQKTFAGASKAAGGAVSSAGNAVAGAASAARRLAGSSEAAAAAQREQKRAAMALVDPLFAVKDAQMGVREAERALDTLRQKGIRSGPKYRQAIDDVYRAHVDLEGAQRELRGSANEAEVSVKQLDAQLRDDMAQANLTRREIDLLAASYRNLASAAIGASGARNGSVSGTGAGGQPIPDPTDRTRPPTTPTTDRVVIEDRTTDGVTARERHSSRMARTRRAR